MKILIILFLFSCSCLCAHPGWGIDVDSKGTIYFTDIINKTIWKIKGGNNPEAFIKNVWSHALLINNKDELYFENEEFEMGNGWISLKKVSENGSVEHVISPTKYGEGFNSPVFTMDDLGNIYFVKNDTLFVRDKLANINAFVTKGINSPNYLTYLPNGYLYFVDRDGIKRVSAEGILQNVALGLTVDDPKDNPYPDDNREVFNRIYGITIDEDGNLYYAYSGNSRVFKIDNSGNKSEFYFSEGPWYPHGLAWHDEKLCVLEEGHSKNKGPEALRIIQIDDKGSIKVLAQNGNLSE